MIQEEGSFNSHFNFELELFLNSAKMSDDQLGYGKEEFDYVHRQVPFFQTAEEVQQKKGKHAMSRFNYLQALVTEFQETNDDGNDSNLMQ